MRRVIEVPTFDDRRALVARVFESVAARQPVDLLERDDIARLLADLADFDDPFSRTAHPWHITGSAFIVGPRGIVLHRHLKLERWLQPGGHVDPGEAPWEGAQREASEETGLAAEFFDFDDDGVPTLAHVSVHDIPNGHRHYDLRYLFDAADADPAPPPEESQQVHWFAWPDAITIAEPAMTAILTDLSHRFA